MTLTDCITSDPAATDYISNVARSWNHYMRFNTLDRGSRISCLTAHGLFAGWMANCFYVNIFGPYKTGADGCEFTNQCTAWKGLIW